MFGNKRFHYHRWKRNNRIKYISRGLGLMSLPRDDVVRFGKRRVSQETLSNWQPLQQVSGAAVRFANLSRTLRTSKKVLKFSGPTDVGLP